MNLRKDHYRWSGGAARLPGQWKHPSPALGPKASISHGARVSSARRSTAPLGGRVGGRRVGPRAPLVSGSLRAAGSRPRGARARSELTLRPPPCRWAASRVPNPPSASGGSAGGSMSPASVRSDRSGGLGAPGGPVASLNTLTRNPCLDTLAVASKQKKSTTLSGGSLGSCVDEERS